MASRLLRVLGLAPFLGLPAACGTGTIEGAAEIDAGGIDLGTPDTTGADGATDGTTDGATDTWTEDGGPDATKPPPTDTGVPESAPPDGPPPDTSVPCTSVPGVTYDTLTISGSPTDRPAAIHGDINLLLRKWEPVPGATKGLVSISGPTDPNAPKLRTLFGDSRTPSFPQVYRVQSWDWGCNCPGAYMTAPEVQLVAMGTTPGEVLGLPAAGYDIGGGHGAMVLYATDDTLTLKYTREDNVVKGYTIHLTSLCVEPSLKTLYESMNKAGRGSLPALKPKQALGRARGASVLAAVRDTGSWMDPRSSKDWW